jgi:hypothetical protein
MADDHRLFSSARKPDKQPEKHGEQKEILPHIHRAIIAAMML